MTAAIATTTAVCARTSRVSCDEPEQQQRPGDRAERELPGEVDGSGRTTAPPGSTRRRRAALARRSSPGSSAPVSPRVDGTGCAIVIARATPALPGFGARTRVMRRGARDADRRDHGSRHGDEHRRADGRAGPHPAPGQRGDGRAARSEPPSCVDSDASGVGIITERDILRSIAAGEDPDVETAHDHQTTEIVYATPDLDAGAGRRSHDARRFPPPRGARRQRGGRDASRCATSSASGPRRPAS